MCGRYTITSAPEAIRALFRYQEQPNFPARYNIAPTQPIPIVRLIDGTAALRAHALGADAVLGEGPDQLLAADQCARRIGLRQAGLPECDEVPPLSDSGGRLL